MTDAAWANVRRFMRAVDRRSFEVDGDDDVRRQFFADAEPGGAAGEVVETAIDHVAEGRWDEATELLRTEFAEKSVCAREEPAYEVPTDHGDDVHFAACHLHRGEDGVRDLRDHAGPPESVED